jgi:hypothetical protein
MINEKLKRTSVALNLLREANKEWTKRTRPRQKPSVNT